MKVNWINEKETLERLINEGVSYERIGRQYDVSGNAVKKAAKKLGIELEQKREINPNEHFNKGKKQTHICINCGKEFEHTRSSKNKFCSNKCQMDYRYKEYIKRWKNGEEDGMSGKYGLSEHIRRYLLEKYNYKCEICDWSEENPHTHTVPLEIHHKDGDYTNNKEENLQLLCPNHHSLTETYKSHNKNGRKGREKYY
jgi:endogenous inhibitor of DNA gyrase (YacG/DUF329 family)